MKDFLQELRRTNIALVTGSYARGEQSQDSDIDFQIKTPRECLLYGGRNPNMDTLIALLKRHGVKWNSTRNGYISTIGEDNDFETEMEFYDDFQRNKKKLDEVIIMDINFKTY